MLVMVFQSLWKEMAMVMSVQMMVRGENKGYGDGDFKRELDIMIKKLSRVKYVM